MASDNLGEARMDATVDASKIPAQMQAVEAAVKQGATKVEQAAKIDPVSDVGEKSAIQIAAVAGAARAAIGALSQAYVAVKQFNDSANQLGKELESISAAFGSIAAVNVDAITAQVNAVEKLAKAQRDLVHQQEMGRNAIQDAIAYYFDNAESAVKLQQIEQARLDTLRRITAEYEAAEKAASNSAFFKQAEEWTKMMDARNKAAAEERKRDYEETMAYEQALQDYRMKNIRETEGAFRSAFDRIKQAQVAAFNPQDIAVQIQQLYQAVDTLVSAQRNAFSGGG